MSVEAITWALKQPISSSPAKFVLVVIANCADGRSFTAYPSIAYLTEATGQDRKTVIANLKRLCEMGYLKDTGHRVGHTKQIIVYQLSEPPKNSTENGTVQEDINSTENGSLRGKETVPKTEPLGAETVPFFPGNSTVFPWKQSQKRDTEPSGIRQGNKTQKSLARASRLPDSGERPFPLPLEWRSFARLENPAWTDAEIQRMADNFADYWLAVSGNKSTKRDWLATWRTWVRKETDRGTHQRHPQPRLDNSAVARVERATAHLYANGAQRSHDGGPLAPDDADLRPPLDVGVRRNG